MSDLAAFLSISAREPFVWGKCDCLTWCADWWKHRTGIDPAAFHRGTYGDERAARRILRDGGGILAFGALLQGVETASPDRGDVGIVKVLFSERGRRQIFVPAGAICMRPDFWVVKTRTGLAGGAFELMRAWTVTGEAASHG